MKDAMIAARGGAPDPMLPDLCEVRRARRETHDTLTLELGARGVRGGFSPGQFNMLYVFGAGEAPVSISGDPGRPDVLVHTTRGVGAVTKAICRLKRGDLLGVRGPYGAGWPVAQAAGNDVVIVAGGIGLAPLRPAIYSLLADRGRYGRIVVLYGTRTPDDILFRREMEQWRSRFDLEVQITVDRAMSSWRGNVGVVTSLVPRAQFDPAGSVAMVCGPETMMRFTTLELQKRGVSPDRIFLSLERSMKCGVGLCGHCQYGPAFICKDGPVFSYGKIRNLFNIREL